MNFVVFPMFVLSSALYPLWKMREASELIHTLCVLNPFTHAVELIRFALYGQFNAGAFWITAGTTVVLTVAAILGFDPGRGMFRKGPPKGA
jgi:ABC-2 type transport system permease protein